MRYRPRKLKHPNNLARIQRRIEEVSQELRDLVRRPQPDTIMTDGVTPQLIDIIEVKSGPFRGRRYMRNGTGQLVRL